MLTFSKRVCEPKRTVNLFVVIIIFLLYYKNIYNYDLTVNDILIVSKFQIIVQRSLPVSANSAVIHYTEFRTARRSRKFIGCAGM